MGFALRTRGGSTSKNRDAVQTPREARRRDLHRAGTWTGSESFVFAAWNWEFSARLDEQIKYFNWSSDLQTCPVGFRVWIAVQPPCPVVLRCTSGPLQASPRQARPCASAST